MRACTIRLLTIMTVVFSCASAVGQTGKPISVPSDPKTHYWALEGKRTSPTVVEILTRREGRSGTSYSITEYDCTRRMYRYLGDGDTLEAAKAKDVAPGPMGPLVSESIATYVAYYACMNIR